MTMVLGLGNPILGDDSLGIRAVERLKKVQLPKGIVLDYSTSSPLSTARKIVDHDKVLLIDSVNLPGKEDGELVKLSLENLSSRPMFVSVHSASLPASLEIYRALYPDRFPKEILVIGVNVKKVEVGESMSETVNGSIEEVVKLILSEVGEKFDE